MATRAVVDTNVISMQFKGDTRAVDYARHLAGPGMVISFQTLAEIDYWVLSRGWSEARRGGLAEYLRRFVVVYPDITHCRLWARLRYDARRHGREIDVADAWVATTAVILGVPLVTHNRRHFVDVEGLTVISEA